MKYKERKKHKQYMQNVTKEIYVKAYPEKNEMLYSGIEFAEFIEGLPTPIENLMTITGDCIRGDTEMERKFELFEGFELIKKLTSADINRLGDFCFVDYDSSCKTSDLSEEQIAELLYLGHMCKPLNFKSPFIDVLQNRFAYLAHDDGWRCKLYCKEPLDVIAVLCNKIKTHMQMMFQINANDVPDDVKEKLFQLTIDGLLIDLNELSCDDETIVANVYTIGTYTDMDTILNNFEQMKLNALHVNQLSYRDNTYTLV